MEIVAGDLRDDWLYCFLWSEYASMAVLECGVDSESTLRCGGVPAGTRARSRSSRRMGCSRGDSASDFE
jgi:hypothetical protein